MLLLGASIHTVREAAAEAGHQCASIGCHCLLSRRCCAARRYELSEEKTFASLFHPDKESILRLVDHFVKKEGKVSRRLLPASAPGASAVALAWCFQAQEICKDSWIRMAPGK